MEDYTSNSKKSKETKPEKKLKKVVEGDVVQKNVPLSRKFKQVFFGGDFKSAAHYVAGDVFLPALRDMMYDSINNGFKNLIYGSSPGSRRRPSEPRGRVQYNNPVRRISDPRAHLPDQPAHPYRSQKTDVRDLILPTREEAERVVEALIEVADQYDAASIADLYELVGLPSAHTDHKWGWTYLTNIEINQVREGWLIALPEAEQL